MTPLPAYTLAPGATVLMPPSGPEGARPDATRPGAAPLLGAAAVTAPSAARMIRLDPRAAEGPDPLAPPPDPAPLKGLGIPPLNTRQVGDFDKLDDTPPPPPPGGGYAGPTDATATMQPRVDLRR
jgi:hypothetical protein